MKSNKRITVEETMGKEGKKKVFFLQTVQEYRGIGGIHPFILNLDTGGR
jgi:hypothetical protein